MALLESGGTDNVILPSNHAALTLMPKIRKNRDLIGRLLGTVRAVAFSARSKAIEDKIDSRIFNLSDEERKYIVRQLESDSVDLSVAEFVMCAMVAITNESINDISLSYPCSAYLDSYSTVDFVILAEKRYGIKLGLDDLDEFSDLDELKEIDIITIRDVCELIERKRSVVSEQ